MTDEATKLLLEGAQHYATLAQQCCEIVTTDKEKQTSLRWAAESFAKAAVACIKHLNFARAVERFKDEADDIARRFNSGDDPSLTGAEVHNAQVAVTVAKNLANQAHEAADKAASHASDWEINLTQTLTQDELPTLLRERMAV